jgi:hypothetical protein
MQSNGKPAESRVSGLQLHLSVIADHILCSLVIPQRHEAAVPQVILPDLPRCARTNRVTETHRAV